MLLLHENNNNYSLCLRFDDYKMVLKDLKKKSFQLTQNIEFLDKIFRTPIVLVHKKLLFLLRPIERSVHV